MATEAGTAMPWPYRARAARDAALRALPGRQADACAGARGRPKQYFYLYSPAPAAG